MPVLGRDNHNSYNNFRDIKSMAITKFTVEQMYDAVRYPCEGVHININETGFKGYVFVNKKMNSVIWLGSVENTKHIFDRDKFKAEPKDRETELGECQIILQKLGVEITEEEILTKVRKPEFVFKRALCCHILRKKGLTLEEIAYVIGVTHGTVHHLLNKYVNKTYRFEMIVRKFVEG